MITVGFLKSKFFIVLVMIAIVLIILPTVLTAFGAGAIVREAIGTLAVPFQWCFTKACDAFDGFRGYFTDYNRLVKENESLKEENARLSESIGHAMAEKDENEWLKSYLALDGTLYDFEMKSATVIATEATNYTTVYTLNCGSLSGVKEKMPVICGTSLVGYVSEVGAVRCKVTPITDSTSSVAAYIERTGASGLLEGDFSLRADGLCKLTGIKENADIEIGDTVVTSGIGSVYPAGIYIGTVSEIESDPYSRTQTATVKPAAEFDSLSHVMIILSYSRTDNSDDE